MGCEGSLHGDWSWRSSTLHSCTAVLSTELAIGSAWVQSECVTLCSATAMAMQHLSKVVVDAPAVMCGCCHPVGVCFLLGTHAPLCYRSRCCYHCLRPITTCCPAVGKVSGCHGIKGTCACTCVPPPFEVTVPPLIKQLSFHICCNSAGVPPLHPPAIQAGAAVTVPAAPPAAAPTRGGPHAAQQLCSSSRQGTHAAAATAHPSACVGRLSAQACSTAHVACVVACGAAAVPVTAAAAGDNARAGARGGAAAAGAAKRVQQGELQQQQRQVGPQGRQQQQGSGSVLQSGEVSSSHTVLSPDELYMDAGARWGRHLGMCAGSKGNRLNVWLECP
jgi:hypothetical protein